MALCTIKNLSFSYEEQQTLQDISFSIEEGQFIALCGLTGSGKSTLLRLLKKELQPVGTVEGTILYNGQLLAEAPTTAISFVMQNPDEQLVMEKVWQELAFPLENQCVPPDEMEQRIAEVLHYLGIHHLFQARTATLSGGQKQLVNLAVALITQPQLLLLDEPTAQLDPLAATKFIELLDRIHRELGLTIFIVEHRLEELVPIVDELIILENQTILHKEAPATLLPKLQHHPILRAFGAAPYISTKVQMSPLALTVQQAKHQFPKVTESFEQSVANEPTVPMLTAQNLYFRFDKKSPDLLHALQLQVGQADVLAVVGGNGTGKSTLLQVLAGILKPYKGKIQQHSPQKHPFAVLPQNPATLFMKNTVQEELDSIKKVATADFEARKAFIVSLLKLESLLALHPSDLSGGQQQLVAFAKVYCLHCPIVLLDEPTKGLDVHVKSLIGQAIQQLQREQVSVVLVTHDLDFAAEYATHCAMLFQGKLTPIQPVRTFFWTNHFYTTSARRIAVNKIHHAITSDEIIKIYTQQGAVLHA